MKGYADLASLPEDARIELIGKYATEHKNEVVGFAVDDQEKADRYIGKLAAKFPSIRVISQKPLIAGTILVQICGGPAQ